MKKRRYAVVSMLLVIAAAVTSFTASGATANTAPYPTGNNIFNVLDYGATRDDGTDDTAAFQKAMNAAAASKGKVLVPNGVFSFKSEGLTLPEGVTLTGTAVSPFRSAVRLDIHASEFSKNINNAFLTMKANSTVQELQFNYPQQVSTDPSPYSWTIRLSGANITVKNIFSMNAYQFLDIGTINSPNFKVEQINLWAYKTGVFVDKCNGSGLIKDVHIWPFDGSNNDWVRENATGFLLGYAKNVTIEGCFTIRFMRSFHLKDFGNGAGHYKIQTSGADMGPVGVLVDNVGSLDINQGQFMQGIEIKSTNKGPVNIRNSGFWVWKDATYQIKAQGTGKVTVDSCHFSSWDSVGEGHYAIVADCSEIVVNSNDFMVKNKNMVSISSNVKNATVINNLMSGKVSIQNKSTGKTNIADNLSY